MTSDFPGGLPGAFGGLGPRRRIAGYVIEEQIGTGGMAVVFRARDELLGRLAAVKVIAPSLAGDPEFRVRFLRESRAAAAVDSLHILPVYGAGETEGLLYIATRFVVGGDLATVVRRAGGRLAADRTASLVTQVASALDAAHAADLVHRDVKPQNILIDTVPERPEHAFLSDFGLAKGTKSPTKLTATGQFVGSPDYASPEQVRNQFVDGRADQYALACVAFVLLAGELPFDRGETMATLYAQVHDPVPVVTEFRPELPAAVNGVIARGLAKSAADRYASCGEFAEALQGALVPVRSATAPSRHRRPSDERTPPPPGTQPAQRQPSMSLADAPSMSAGSSRSRLAGGAVVAPDGVGYASTVAGGNQHPGYLERPANGAPERPPQHRHHRTGRQRRRVLIGGTAAIILAAGGIIYAVSPPARSHGTASPGASSPRASSSSSPSPSARPVKPVLAAFPVPAGGTVDSTWFSADGKLIAATKKSDASKIYVWNTESRSYVTTLTLPIIYVGKSPKTPAVYDLVFSVNDDTLTVAIGPNYSGAPVALPYFVYRWNLANYKRTLVTSLTAPADDFPLFSGNDEKIAMTSDSDNTVEVSTVGSAEQPQRITVPIGATVMGLDNDGGRLLTMTYGTTSNTVQVLNTANGKTVAEVPDDPNLYPSISGDGQTVAESPGFDKSYPEIDPMLWSMHGGTDFTPSDPRWRQQLLGLGGFSSDGSVFATVRDGGAVDLWNVATGQYLLTVTDHGYRADSDNKYVDPGNVGDFVGPGGSEVAILAGDVVNPAKVAGDDEFRQVDVWQTPLSPPLVMAGTASPAALRRHR